MCTMCSDAPVIAAAPITSLTASIADPGSTRPALRMCVYTGTPAPPPDGTCQSLPAALLPACIESPSQRPIRRHPALPAAPLDSFDLLRRGRQIGRRSAFRENLRRTTSTSDNFGRQRRPKHRSPRRYMAGRRSVMNQRVTFFRFQEFRNVGRTDFQFQRAGHPVQRLDPLACHILAMLVQINESWSNHQPASMNHPLPSSKLQSRRGQSSHRECQHCAPHPAQSRDR